VFFASAGEKIPQVLFAYYRMAKSLPSQVILLTMQFLEIPFVARQDHVKGMRLAQNMSAVVASQAGTRG